MKKRYFIIGFVVICLALYIGDYAYFTNLASADSTSAQPRKEKKVEKNHDQQAPSQKQERQEQKGFSQISNDRITKPEYANVNDFISAMAKYFSGQVQQKGSYATVEQRQLNAANAVDVYVDYFKRMVKSQSEKKALLKAQLAAENFKTYKDPKYLKQLQNIFDGLNQ